MEGEELEQVERFTYLASCISTNGNITSEITARISNAQAAFSTLRNLWRFTNVSLATRDRVYNVTVRFDSSIRLLDITVALWGLK